MTVKTKRPLSKSAKGYVRDLLSGEFTKKEAYLRNYNPQTERNLSQKAYRALQSEGVQRGLEEGVEQQLKVGELCAKEALAKLQKLAPSAVDNIEEMSDTGAVKRFGSSTVLRANELIVNKAIPSKEQLEIKHTADPELLAGSVASAMLIQNASRNLILSAVLAKGADFGALVRALQNPTESDDPSKPTLYQLLTMAISQKMEELKKGMESGEISQQKLIELSRPPDPSKQAWQAATEKEQNKETQGGS